MSYIFWKLWHSAIIWPIWKPFEYILRCVRVVLTQRIEDLTPLPKWSVVLLLKSLFWGGSLWAVVVVKFLRVFNNTAWYYDQSYMIITLCKHRLAVDDNDNDYIDDDDDDEDGGSVKSECRSSHLNEPRKLGSKATLGTASAWGYQFTFSQCGTALSTISPKYKCFRSLNKTNG